MLFFWVAGFSFFFLMAVGVRAQSPKTAFYYNPSAEFPFAQCYVYLQGGSRLKIPFLPVVDRSCYVAPMGTGYWTKDVKVDSPIVFIGNGIVEEDLWNCYQGRKYDYSQGEIDVAGKAVLFCYDFPDKIESLLEGKETLRERIAEAASRKASAVILFSWKTGHPFLTVRSINEADVPDIPVITITRDSAEHIFQSSGLDETVFESWEKTGKPQSVEFISRVNLNIRGKFERVETDHFLICYRKEEFPSENM